MSSKHEHFYFSADHNSNEWRAWGVITLCAISMIVEIVCGIVFGSLALVADGIHMSTHCIAFFITATAYSYSRRHAADEKYVFGTGKIGELAAYTSAVILIIVAAIILYQGISRFIFPTPLEWKKALPVAFVGLAVNIGSGFMLACNCKKKTNDSGEMEVEMAHGHSHGHATEKYEYHLDDDHAHAHDHDETFHIDTAFGTVVLSIFEEGIPPMFRVVLENWSGPALAELDLAVQTNRPNKTSESFQFELKNENGQNFLQSTMDIPEPHEFSAVVTFGNSRHVVEFKEGEDHHEDHHGNHCDDHHAHAHDHDETFHIDTSSGTVVLSIFEEGIPPVFRVVLENWSGPALAELDLAVQTNRPNKTSESFQFELKNENGQNFLQSTKDIPEPHEFSAVVTFGNSRHVVEFKEVEDHHEDHHANHCEDHDHHTDHGHDSHDHGEHEHCGDHDHNHSAHDHDEEEAGLAYCRAARGSYSAVHTNTTTALATTSITTTASKPVKESKKKYAIDNNFRAALIHVVADAFVSCLVIFALVIAGQVPGTDFLDPLVGIIGSLVILSWGCQLMWDTSSNLLDINPDLELTHALRHRLEKDGSVVTDLHVWRLGPGHLGAIASVGTVHASRDESYYKSRIVGFKALSHITIEVSRL